MRWLNRFRRHQDIPADLPPLDVDALIHQVRTDPARARVVEPRLRERHEHLLQRRKALAKRSSRPTPGQLRNTGRVGMQIGAAMFQQEIRSANDAGASGYDADLERQVIEITDALSTIRAIVRGDA
jgi:hypothetical protein